jgi:hypothetical protein
MLVTAEEKVLRETRSHDHTMHRVQLQCREAVNRGSVSGNPGVLQYSMHITSLSSAMFVASMHENCESQNVPAYTAKHSKKTYMSYDAYEMHLWIGLLVEYVLKTKLC